jgi:hypothetical protein
MRCGSAVLVDPQTGIGAIDRYQIAVLVAACMESSAGAHLNVLVLITDDSGLVLEPTGDRAMIRRSPSRM